ncbi:hypothetical protein NBRC116597_14580 [Phaeobacter sp. NW0010-22]
MVQTTRYHNFASVAHGPLCPLAASVKIVFSNGSNFNTRVTIDALKIHGETI